MLKTPKLHFDLVRRAVPQVDFIHRLMMERHESFSDDELRRGVCSSLVEQMEGTTKFMAYQLMLYDRFGQNSYVVGPRVQDLFRRTDLSKITPDMVVDPQTGFYVALPDCPWRIWGGDRTQWHGVEGIYVAFTQAVDATGMWGDVQTVPLERKRERGIHFTLWGGPNERSVSETDDAILWFSINLEKWVREGEDIETFFRRHSVMVADQDNTDRWDGKDPLDPFEVPLIPAANEDVLEQRETLVNVMRLVLNLCLYMASDERELKVVDNADEVARIKRQIGRKKTPGKRKTLERRLANLPRTRVVYIGPLFEQPEKEPGEHNGGAGGSHASPIEHAVPPHWQHYWVGSGDDKRRILRHKGMYRRGSGKPDRTIVKIRE